MCGCALVVIGKIARGVDGVGECGDKYEVVFGFEEGELGKFFAQAGGEEFAAFVEFVL